MEKVREAQRIVGELVWLVTRCRPDLMYVLNRMAVWTTRQPDRVASMAMQVWRFLAQSRDEGLIFAVSDDPSRDIEVFTDASFGEECQGCVVVKWAGSPVLWKSSRQTVQTTSTAGAELYEIMEGATMAEAIRVIAEELFGDRIRCWQYTDSASALAIVVGDTSSWRTKHLRRRARFLRWRVLRGDVVMRHLPGVQMIADLGTKALTAMRFRELKVLLGMQVELEDRELQVDRDDGPAVQRREEQLPVGGSDALRPRAEGNGFGSVHHASEGDRMKLAIMLAVLARAAGMAEEHRGLRDEAQADGMISRWWTLLGTLLAMVVAGMFMWRERRAAARVPNQRLDPGDPSENSEVEREEPQEESFGVSGPELPAGTDQIPLAALLQGADEAEFRAWEDEHERDLNYGPGSQDEGEVGEGEMVPDGPEEPREETMQEYLFRTTGVRAIQEVYVSVQGRCYHHNWLCTGLARAEHRMAFEWCEECFMRFRPGMVLCSPTNAQMLHLDGAHGLGDNPGGRRARRFRACRLCVRPFGQMG